MTKPAAMLTRRAALARLGLAVGVVGAAYTAPAMVGFDAARASGNSRATAPSPASAPSRSSGPSRSGGSSGSRNSGPSRSGGRSGNSGPSRTGGSSSNQTGSTWHNSYPSRPRPQRPLTEAERQAIETLRSVFGG